jgi:hypothetical protein
MRSTVKHSIPQKSKVTRSLEFLSESHEDGLLKPLETSPQPLVSNISGLVLQDLTQQSPSVDETWLLCPRYPRHPQPM